ncbi:MAG TPA: efflux RND transporter periplasmic adaptor subunit [Gemmatimonadales bacterium]|nr:efflux RND transporter periplasmic adaptor subunit [Gemmatimonadales bacterium]
MTKSISLVVAISAFLLVTACGSKPPAKPPRQAVAVTVIPVRRQSVPYTIDATGMVTPMQTAAVTAQVDGIVIGVEFSEGQDVSKGQVLFRIDPRPYQAAHDQAVAALARDKAAAQYANEQFQRYDALMKDRSVTAEQADQMRANAASATATVSADSAQLATAQFNLDNTVIRAPITGRTGGLLIHVGNVVHAAGSAPLVLINQVRPTLVRFPVPGASLPLILRYGARGGLPVTATPADVPTTSTDSTTPMDASQSGTPAQKLDPVAPIHADPDTRGALSFIDNAIDTTTATVMLKAVFPNPNGTLWAGQSVTTSLRLYVEDSVLVVPTAAVVIGQTGTYVWVVDSANTAQEHPVVVERAAGDMSVITSGVSEGDRVVTNGQSRLSVGAPITLSTPNGDATGGRRGGKGGAGRGGRGGGRGKAPTAQ